MRSKIYTILLMALAVARASAANPTDQQLSQTNTITSANQQNVIATIDHEKGNGNLLAPILEKASKISQMEPQNSNIVNVALNPEILKSQHAPANRLVTDSVNNKNNPELNKNAGRIVLGTLPVTEKTNANVKDILSLEALASADKLAKVQMADRTNKIGSSKLKDGISKSTRSNLLVLILTNSGHLNVALPATNNVLSNGQLTKMSYRVKDSANSKATASVTVVAEMAAKRASQSPNIYDQQSDFQGVKGG